MSRGRGADGPSAGVARPDPTWRATASLLADRQFVRLVRWVFTARLVCLALAAPAALIGPGATAAATASLLLLTASSLVLSRSDRVIRLLIAHPLLASPTSPSPSPCCSASTPASPRR